MALANTDIIITGGTVIDGTGAPGREIDVLIRDGVITAIADLSLRAGEEPGRVIDATGMVVTPGFIDTHAHEGSADDSHFENSLAMGATTICLGQDGSSPAGEDLLQWMEETDQTELGPNIAMFVGHGSVREHSGAGYDPEPTPEQIETMGALVDAAMEAGCFGLTTGLEYDRGRPAGAEELAVVAEPVARHGGIVMSHMRSEDDDVIEDAIGELIAQGRAAGCPVHISHLKIVYGHGAERAEEILALLQAARDSGQEITADLYPYTASFTGIGIVFPDWAKAPHDFDEVVATRREELEDYLRRRVTLRNGPEATLFGTGQWTGKTLAEAAEDAGKPFEDLLIDDIGRDGARAAYFVMDEEVMERFFLDPHVMICSDGSPTVRHPRGHGTFAKIIDDFVVERELIPLEQAIHKMTGLPAATLDLDDQRRGTLAEGNHADILIFNPASVSDPATFEEPHQLAQGIDWVIVNGEIVRERGEFTGIRAGRLLRHRATQGP
jgi:N-acyl-D-amino-acid deacylase